MALLRDADDVNKKIRKLEHFRECNMVIVCPLTKFSVKSSPQLCYFSGNQILSHPIFLLGSTSHIYLHHFGVATGVKWTGQWSLM